jgi:23S rRNA pseudouridine2605 synthase
MADDEKRTGERIAKRLARAGIASRREAERMIEAGRVSVDGKRIDTPVTLVDESSDVRVDGKPVAAPEPPRVWRYHKPAGVICTASDPEGRPTVFDRLPAHMPRVMLVGRLDLTSEGLLLLTNDGALARRMELPATGWVRRYRVRVFGTPDEAALAKVANGVTVDGMKYGPIQARLDTIQGSNAWITVALREGRNREVRRVMEHLGLRVNRLIRTAYGPFQLGNLARDAVDETPSRVVADQLGLKPTSEEKRARRRR